MQFQLKLEEALLFGLSIFAFSLLDFPWWYYPALLLAPDIGMAGYAINTRVGAIAYNVFHHKGVSAVLLALAWQLANPWLLLAGIIHFGHGSMDRMLGYGLKYADSFKNTHLGKL